MSCCCCSRCSCRRSCCAARKAAETEEQTKREKKEKSGKDACAALTHARARMAAGKIARKGVRDVILRRAAIIGNSRWHWRRLARKSRESPRDRDEHTRERRSSPTFVNFDLTARINPEMYNVEFRSNVDAQMIDKFARYFNFAQTQTNCERKEIKKKKLTKK